MSGGGTQTTTEQSFTQYPQWTQDAQRGTYQQGTGMLENFLRNPQYLVPGFTTDAMKGFDLTRDTARTAFTSPQIGVPGAGTNLNPALASAAFMSPASMGAASMGAASMGAASMTPAQVTGGEIQSLMSPFLQSVLDPTIATMQRNRDTQDAQIGARYAAQAGLGGSGEAISRGQLNRSFGEQVAQTTATLMAQGYDKATATAMANAQMRQQASAVNSGYDQDAMKTNAGLLQDALRANAGFAQDASKTNAGFSQATNLANQAAENAMKSLGLDYGLKGAQVQDQLRTSQQAREMAIVEQILKNAQAQRGVAGESLTAPFTALQMLMGLTPQQMNSQTFGKKETEGAGTSPLQTIAGLGASLLGAKTIGGGSLIASLFGK